MLVRTQSHNEEQKKSLARDTFAVTATHSDHIYDVTDTDCWAQNGITHGRISIFRDKQT